MARKKFYVIPDYYGYWSGLSEYEPKDGNEYDWFYANSRNEAEKIVEKHNCEVKLQMVGGECQCGYHI